MIHEDEDDDEYMHMSEVEVHRMMRESGASQVRTVKTGNPATRAVMGSWSEGKERDTGKHMTVDEAIETLREGAVRLLEETGRFDAVVAFVGCVGVDDTVALVPQLGSSDHVLKRSVGSTISNLAKEWHAQAVVVAHDGWYVTPAEAEEAAQPSEHPNRKEAMCISVIAPDGSVSIRMFPYRREKIGRLAVAKDGSKSIRMADTIVWEALPVFTQDVHNSEIRSIIPAWVKGGSA
jgi:hypothetical protein